MAVATKKALTKFAVTGIGSTLATLVADLSDAITVATNLGGGTHMDIRLTTTITVPSLGDIIAEFYAIRTVDTEEEKTTLTTPASLPADAWLGAVEANSTSTAFIGILRDVPVPPTDFKLAVKNLDTTTFTSAINIDIQPWQWEIA